MFAKMKVKRVFIGPFRRCWGVTLEWPRDAERVAPAVRMQRFDRRQDKNDRVVVRPLTLGGVLTLEDLLKLIATLQEFAELIKAGTAPTARK